jgi:hypothetical protein
MIRRRSVWFLTLLILLAGCQSQKGTVAATPSLPPTTAANQGYPVQFTPTPYAPAAYPVGTVKPTIDPTQPAAMQQTSFAIVQQTQSAQFTAIPTPKVDYFKPACVPGAEYTACHDDILAIDFEYPTAWGEFTSMLYPGSNVAGGSGFGYDYSFNPPSSPLTAGGRSRDFGQGGRGGMWVDFGGFEADQPLAQAAKSVCRNYGAAVCTTIQTRVVFMISYPVADYVCATGPGIIDSPVGTIAIDLPDNPKINGFVFTSHILSDKRTHELLIILGVGGTMMYEACNEAGLRQQFDAKLKEIKDAIEAGTVDSVTQTNIDRLLHLAQSIQFH